MSHVPHIRTVDRFEFLKFDDSEFKVRSKTPVSRMTGFCMAMSLLVIAVSIIYFPDDLTGFFLCLGTGLLVFFMALQLEQMRRIQLSTEFVNALMTSAIARHWDFTMAVRNDGEVIYLNRGFHHLFPAFIHRDSLTFAAWLSCQRVQMEEIEQLTKVLAAGEEISRPLVLRIVDSELALLVTLQIEAVERPRGYSLIRGKIEGPASVPAEVW